MCEKSKYYAVIPLEVLHDHRLPAIARNMYADILSLSQSNGYCWATNEYFEKTYDISKATVKRHIKALRDSGYIDVVINYASNGEVEKRCITPLCIVNPDTSVQTRAGGRFTSEPEVNSEPTLGSNANLPSVQTRAGGRFTSEPENNINKNNINKNNINTIKGENKISAQAQDNPDPDIVEAEVLDESEAVQDSFELVPQQAPATVKQATAYSAEFETFWKAYPIRKVKKRLAYQQWCKTIKHVAVNTIMQGLERVKQGDITYMPEPMRWLRDERWEDEADFSELLKNPAVKRERENQFMSNYIRENAQQLAQYNPWE